MPPNWSIGIMTGDSPLHLKPDTRARNPVLTAGDITGLDAAFVADPFMLLVRGVWYMFFEAVGKAHGRGEIALAMSDDGYTWQYRQVVLSEPHHLSYPCVFESGGEYYMIPETLQPRAIRLYVATSFPSQWRFAADLVPVEAADPTILWHDGTWWLFACIRRNDWLGIYFADSLTGPWAPHPGNPVVNDVHGARPAGRLVNAGGKLIRFAQDCAPRYGRRVRAFEILVLTRDSYVEREYGGSPVTAPAAAWCASRMHHVDAHSQSDGTWIACVDGC